MISKAQVEFLVIFVQMAGWREGLIITRIILQNKKKYHSYKENNDVYGQE